MSHLPRLWLKILLHGCGRLPPGYRHGIGGFDEFLLTTLGLDRDAFIAFVRDDKPSYLALEAWVRAHATALTAEAIATVNGRVESAELPVEMRPERFARLEFSDASYTRAVALNDLDDWASLHEALTAAG